MIARLANRQSGVVSRRQLLSRGITAKSIERRREGGRLRTIHRGVYAVGHDAIPVRGRVCAGLLVAGATLSHRSAAYVWRLISSMPPFVDISTTKRAPRNRPGLLFHHATALETTRRHDLPITTPIRTLKDLAATRPHPEVERAASEARVLRLVTAAELSSQHGPGAAVLAKLVGAGIGPTRSGLERAFFNYHDHAIAVRRDSKRNTHLQFLGCSVIRIPENELPDAPAAVARFLNRPASRTAP